MPAIKPIGSLVRSSVLVRVIAARFSSWLHDEGRSFIAGPMPADSNDPCWWIYCSTAVPIAELTGRRCLCSADADLHGGDVCEYVSVNGEESVLNRLFGGV